jgi:hypothetical protein
MNLFSLKAKSIIMTIFIIMVIFVSLMIIIMLLIILIRIVFVCNIIFAVDIMQKYGYLIYRKSSFAVEIIFIENSVYCFHQI